MWLEILGQRLCHNEPGMISEKVRIVHFMIPTVPSEVIPPTGCLNNFS